MERESPRHEKVRFRRREIKHLDALPSACRPFLSDARKPLLSRLRRAALKGAAGLLVLLAVLVGAVYLIGVSGLGSERLRLSAENALTALAGTDIDTTLGRARLSLDRSQLIALEVRDVGVVRAETGLPLVDAGLMKFGVRFLPLLSGDVRIGSANIADATIRLDAMPARADRSWTDGIVNEQGLVDPNKASSALFSALRDAFKAIDRSGTSRIELRNVVVVFGLGSPVRQMRIVDLVARRRADGSLTFAGEASADERTITLDGQTARSADAARIDNFALALSVGAKPKPPSGSPTERMERQGDMRLGPMRIAVSGKQTAGQGGRIEADAALESVRIGEGMRQIEGAGALRVSVADGADKVELEKLHLTVGRTLLDFHGALGPTPAQAGAKPTYRFELVSDGSTVAPDSSPEPAVTVFARVAGTFAPSDSRLAIDQIGIRTAQGELEGKGELLLPGAGTPGVSIAVNVPSMPVSQVKQLWPWFAAPGARSWVLQNVYGGRVVDSRVAFDVEPGRLGNGVPLAADEINGRFVIDGSRFDTAGHIPPVRDAKGAVDFRGNDLDITLSSGTVYMPSGRTVAASGGVLTIRDAHVSPLIGKLSMNVAGEAAAVTELASYDPINALRYLELAPEDFTGNVTGKVQGDIPLQLGIPPETLDWRVALDYTGLSVAKPFSGQKVTDAQGSILVTPKSAVIKAKARLNGVAADLDVTEPIGGSSVAKTLMVTLSLDDKAREALVPGLSQMLAGPASVGFERLDETRQKVTADLARATVSLPWVGWSKGAGVPAKASFILDTSGSMTRLQDFRLDGESFSASGVVTLNGNSLSSGRFDKVRLNRGDDFSVDIKADGKGYTVRVRGNALDARSIIKQFDVDAPISDGARTPVTVDAQIAALLGFYGESLSAVKLSYRSGSGDLDGMDATAATRSGTPVMVKDAMNAGRRSVTLQSRDAGAVLRFLNIYDKMEGGDIGVALGGPGGGALSGQIDARNFWLVDEPRLRSLVSTAPPDSDGRTLNDAVKRDIDVSRVQFERGFSQIEKGRGYLKTAQGVVRGPLIGMTFQGTVYDPKGMIDLTGTFMPAYGLNRIFGEIPILGQILGNGRDRGLIGITFRLAGKASDPELQVNPLSIIAPGIFRSVFEFR